MLSLANVSAAQAENYYEKDDYYSRGESEQALYPDINLNPDSQWEGKGAAALALSGEVDKRIFKQLLHGQTPNGRSLHGQAINPENHRAATDYTFSAPKSVSIAALIQKDKRVIAAHDAAVKTALTVLEQRYAQTRVRRGPGIRERVKTDSLIAATFRHETSREQDPQLHTHCVVVNATQLENGKWQSMANEDVLINQKLLGEIYQNELAVQLRQHGYEIEPNGSGQFECKGYEKPLLNLFSTRTQQIEAYIEQWEAALKEAKGKPLHAKQKKQATLATRVRKKTVPREVLLDGWHRAVEASELHLPATPKTEAISIESQATKAATEGVSHAAERESVFKVEKVERFALEHHLGEQSFAELQSAISAAGLVAAKERYTTEQAIDRELETIAIMKSAQGQVDSISTPAQVTQLTQLEKTLTAGQYNAILESATSRDQVMAWQGVAGAGKTYSLKLLAQLATEQGYAVTGYAPSAQAANILTEEANIESHTVARLLHRKRPRQDQTEAKQKALWIVDEAGLLSAKDAHALLKKAQTESAQVILVGDTRQLSAVEAGNPFRSLQAAGMKTAYLEESRRQKTVALRAAVVCLAVGEQTEGLNELDRAGMVQELSSSAARHQALTLDYMSQSPEEREQTLILSGTNVERRALTAALRAALQQEGSLGADTFTMRSLRSQDRTAAQLQYAFAYEVGDVVVPVKDYSSYGMERRQQYTVVSEDIERNRLVLRGPDGKTFEFNPADCADKTTYAVQEIVIALGDQLRWTRNEAFPGVRNGQLVTVEAIDAAGSATLSDHNGRTMSVELTGQQYLDYALVSTTYSSQGRTADRVLADIDTTLSREGLYVAVSRAKTKLSLYTADKAQLYKRAQRSAAKENPSDVLTLFELVNPDAQDKKATHPARALPGAARAEHIGDRVAESHQAAVRRDGADERRAEPIERTAASLSLGVRADAAQSHRAATDASRELAAVASRRRALADEWDKRRRRREIYQEFAEKVSSSKTIQIQDWKIAKYLLVELLRARNGALLTQEEQQMATVAIQESPEARRLEQSAGRDSAHQYATEVVARATQRIMEQIKQARQQQRDGIDL